MVVNLRIAVRVPYATSPEEVAEAINRALDEPPCDWGRWTVGAALIDTDGVASAQP